MLADAGRYEILSPIAAGGMGEVLLARSFGEHGVQKTVALKRIRPELNSHGGELFLQFISEAKLAISLSHANLVQVFDFARFGPDLFLVMEYVHGADLAQVIKTLDVRQQQLPVGMAVRILMEALQGLAYAHQRADLLRGGVVHCDLSPSNILLSYSGEVKVTDFGVAQPLRRTKGQGGRVMGKRPYMAEEQLRGSPVDGRTDLFALAATAYELLTLKRAFPGGTSDLSSPMPRGLPPRIRSLRREVPERLSQLLERTLSETPALRPVNAQAMLLELAQVQREIVVPTAPEVGAWLHALVPPREQQLAAGPLHGLDAMLGGRLGPGTKSGSVSLQLSPLVHKTFLAEPGADGTTVFVELPTRSLDGAPVPTWRRALQLSAIMVVAVSLGFLAVGLGTGRFHPAAPPGAATESIPAAPPPSTPRAVKPPAPDTPTAVPLEASRPAHSVHPGPGSRPTASARRPNGALYVYAQPWARVLVDGHKVGNSPLAGYGLEAGSHKITLVHPDFAPVERTVHIEPGKPSYLDVDLRK